MDNAYVVFRPSHSVFYAVLKYRITCTVCAGNSLPTSQSKHGILGLTLEGPKGSLSNVSEEVLVLEWSVCVRFDLGLETVMHAACLFEAGAWKGIEWSFREI